MWFTFLYGTAIPLGIFFSIFGLIIYYFIDKYNLLRRRTIKENLGSALSNEMIEMLELIIFFKGFGDLTMSYNLFGQVNTQDLIVLIISVLYNILPMQIVSEKLFPVPVFQINILVLLGHR